MIFSNERINKLLVLIVLFLCYNAGVKAQSNRPEKERIKAGTIYGAFGINRSFYSKSDIAFKSSGFPFYDFTLENVRAKDDQGFKFHNGAPQYSYELGYYSN